MNFVRTNFVSLILIVMVTAVTGLNTFITKSNCDLFLSGVAYNNDEMARNKLIHDSQVIVAIKEEQLARITSVAESETQRALQSESNFNYLAGKYVELRQVLNKAGMEIYALQELLKIAGEHIEECHRLMREKGIEPPVGSPLTPPINPTAGAGEDKSA